MPYSNKDPKREHIFDNHPHGKVAINFMDIGEEGPPPCNSDIIGIERDLNTIPVIPYSHYYKVGGST